MICMCFKISRSILLPVLHTYHSFRSLGWFDSFFFIPIIALLFLKCSELTKYPIKYLVRMEMLNARLPFIQCFHMRIVE